MRWYEDDKRTTRILSELTRYERIINMPKLDLYNQIRPQIKTGDDIVWQSNSIIGKSIQWWCNSKYNHVSKVVRFTEFDIERVYIMEELGHGAVLLPLSKRIEEHDGHVWLFPLESKLNPIRRSMAAWMLMKLGTPYGYRGLIANLAGRINQDMKEMICSEYSWLGFEYGAGIERDGGFLPQYLDCTRPVQVVAQEIHKKVHAKIGENKVPRPSDWTMLQEVGMFMKEIQLL